MKIIKVQGFEGTQFEEKAKQCIVTRIIKEVNNWVTIGYKVPGGRKEYQMHLRSGDVV